MDEASETMPGPAAGLAAKVSSRTALVGIIGLGYVGLPLAMAVARAGFPVIGLDIDEAKIAALNAGSSYIDAVASPDLSGHVKAGRFRASGEFGEISRCDVVIICVPTPLSRHREPDLSHVRSTAASISDNLRGGQLVVLESTTYPGTTIEVVRPILNRSGLGCGVDFWLAYSPEREDPGNREFHTAAIPKIVGGDGRTASRLAVSFYDAVVERVVEVSSPSTAEAVKITENVFRAVNIALVNELKLVFSEMGIDIWEVIEAAASKPFGYMPFYPGPGLGGHCIPIDPFYLAWKSREFDQPTRFIELAGEINRAMPRHVVANLEKALDERQSRSLGASRVLLLGLAYKKNVSDIRESPAFAILELLEGRGTIVDYADPHVPVIPPTREHGHLSGRRAVVLDPPTIAGHDAVVVITDHDDFDYPMIAANARLIVDTRNAFARRGLAADNVVKS